MVLTCDENHTSSALFKVILSIVTLPSVQGDLKQFSPKTVLERIAQEKLEGILHFRFADEIINTKMIVAGQRLGGIISPFVPQWSNLLVPKFMNSEVYERARLQHIDAAGALRSLEQQGVLPRTSLENILSIRAKMALLPILSRSDGRFLFVPRIVTQDFLEPGIGISPLLEQLAAQTSIDIEPSATYQVFENTVKHSQHLDAVSLEIIAALANELTLLEVAQRTHLMWDELGQKIRTLESQGMIRLQLPTEVTRFEAFERASETTFKPTKRIRQRLIPGDLAPDFVLSGLGGTVVRLSAYKGKRVLIRFNRQAGCPICNPRNREFIRLYPQFQQANVELIGIFGSSEDVLPLGIGKQNPPYPVLADPQDTIYAKYGVERSLWGLLSPKNWQNMDSVKEGTKMETFRPNGDGEVTRMPAEFLINEEGYIEQAHYHAFATDFLPLETLLTDWLKIRSK